MFVILYDLIRIAFELFGIVEVEFGQRRVSELSSLNEELLSKRMSISRLQPWILNQ